MDVLATQFKRNAEQREGYLSISDVAENNFKQYIFNSAIKLKVTKNTSDISFTKWVAYWEDSPIAIEMTVITSVLPTGYIKATIVDKKVRPVEDIGIYPAKNSKVFGRLVDNKFMLEGEQLSKYVENKMKNAVELSSPVQTSVLDQSKIDQIKEAWGIKK